MSSAEDVLSTAIELERSHEYETYPIAQLSELESVWTEQRSLTCRSQRSIEEVDVILGRLVYARKSAEEDLSMFEHEFAESNS